MLKFQIALIAVLIGCIGFVACERTQDLLEPVMMDPEITEMAGMDAHKSWEHKMIEGPWLDFKGDVAHDLGSRTIYFNEAAAMANKAGTAYPVGAMIIKESMDATNTFVSQVSTMMKIDAADNDGWVYGLSGMPVSAAGDLTMPNQLTAEMGAGCHGCHANATNDFVFVPLSMADGAGDTNGDGAGDTNGDGAGDTNGDGAGDTNGDGAGDTNGDGAGDTNGDGAGDTNGDGAGDTNGDGAGDTNGDGAGDTNGDGAGNSIRFLFCSMIPKIRYFCRRVPLVGGLCPPDFLTIVYCKVQHIYVL